jgi:hypothetical protein
MRAAGLLISFCCLLGSIVTLWIGYDITIGESAREGWDQKDFWRIVWWFSFYVALALGGFLMPFIASFRSREDARVGGLSSWALFALAALYTWPWVLGVAELLRRLGYLAAPNQRGDFDPIFVIPPVMLVGSVFAMSVFFIHIRRNILIWLDERRQHTIDT